MNTLLSPPITQRIRLLTSSIAQRHLISPVLRGEQLPPAAAIDRASTPWDESVRGEAGPVRDLVEAAMQRFAHDERARADAWLAPRLHATLRITRREAADAQLWNHLALRVAPDYVQWRHRSKAAHGGAVAAVQAARYSGPFHTQTFSRLWWAAELFRDGSDYGPAAVACGNQDILNTVLRLEMISHRPTAQAFVSMIQRGAIRTGREANAAAKAVNAAGSTLSYESIASDAPPDSAAYRAWVESVGESPAVSYTRLPEGPPDGGVDLDQVDILVPLFDRLFDRTTVRGHINADSD